MVIIIWSWLWYYVSYPVFVPVVLGNTFLTSSSDILKFSSFLSCLGNAAFDSSNIFSFSSCLSNATGSSSFSISIISSSMIPCYLLICGKWLSWSFINFIKNLNCISLSFRLLLFLLNLGISLWILLEFLILFLVSFPLIGYLCGFSFLIGSKLLWISSSSGRWINGRWVGITCRLNVSEIAYPNVATGLVLRW